jgi:hypothetical protein
MKTKTYFTFRVDIWDADANSIVEHVAGCGRFRGRGSDLPGRSNALARAARITLRQGARIVYESG